MCSSKKKLSPRKGPNLGTRCLTAAAILRVCESTSVCIHIIKPLKKTIHETAARAKNAALISWISNFCPTTQICRCCWPSGRFNSSRPIKCKALVCIFIISKIRFFVNIQRFFLIRLIVLVFFFIFAHVCVWAYKVLRRSRAAAAEWCTLTDKRRKTWTRSPEPPVSRSAEGWEWKTRQDKGTDGLGGTSENPRERGKGKMEERVQLQQQQQQPNRKIAVAFCESTGNVGWGKSSNKSEWSPWHLKRRESTWWDASSSVAFWTWTSKKSTLHYYYCITVLIAVIVTLLLLL